MDKKYIVHTVIAWMMLVTLIILAYYAVIMAPWQIVVSSLVVILPIFTAGLYTAKLHKIHRLQLYHSQGIVFRILSGTAFSTIFWILIAIVDGALIFGQTSLRPISLNIKTLSLYLLLFMLCKPMLNKIVGKTYKEYYKPLVIMFWASITSAFFSSLIWAYSDPLQIGMLPEFRSIAEVYTYILGQRPEPFAKCLGLFQDLITFKESFFLYIISKYSNAYINFIINFISQFIFFIGLGPFFSLAFLSLVDLKRIWSPPSETLLPISLKAIFWSAFLGVIGIGAYGVLLVSNERTIQQIKPVVDTTLHTVIQKVDKILVEEDSQGRLLQRGTVERYNALVVQTASTQIKNFVAEEIRLTNHIYDSLENNVDNYLDWYYSLAADYTRLIKLFTGTEAFENYMEEKFQEYLVSPQTEKYLKEMLTIQDRMMKDLSLPSYSEFIEDKIVTIGPSEIAEKIPAPPVITIPEILQKIKIANDAFNVRIGAATGLGVAATVGAKLIAKKIAAKVAAKGTFKIAAKVVAQIVAKAATKAGIGAAGGAAIGAAIGSIVPGVGTGIGALVGGVIAGVATWVGTDVVLLKAEELLERTKYREELVQTINEERTAEVARLKAFLEQCEQNLDKLNHN